MVSMNSYNSKSSKNSKSKKFDIKSMGRGSKKSHKIEQKVGPKNFSVIKLLGTGSFGEVFLVIIYIYMMIGFYSIMLFI